MGISYISIMYCVECGWFFEKNCMYVIYWVVCGWVSGVGDLGNFGWYVGGYLELAIWVLLGGMWVGIWMGYARGKH